MQDVTKKENFTDSHLLPLHLTNKSLVDVVEVLFSMKQLFWRRVVDTLGLPLHGDSAMNCNLCGIFCKRRKNHHVIRTRNSRQSTIDAVVM
jgi:hypothetical protein